MRSTLRSRTVQTPIALSSSWRSSVQSLFHHRSRRLFVVASEWRSLPLSSGPRTSTREERARKRPTRRRQKRDDETTRRLFHAISPSSHLQKFPFLLLVVFFARPQTEESLRQKNRYFDFSFLLLLLLLLLLYKKNRLWTEEEER